MGLGPIHKFISSFSQFRLRDLALSLLCPMVLFLLLSEIVLDAHRTDLLGVIRTSQTSNIMMLDSREIMTALSALENEYFLDIAIGAVTPNFVKMKDSLFHRMFIREVTIPFGAYQVNGVYSTTRAYGLSLLGSLILSPLILFYFAAYSRRQVQIAIESEKIKSTLRINELARRTAHDIRSPLTALLALTSNSPELPDKKRKILHSVTERINDLAENLLHYDRSFCQETTRKVLVPELLTELVKEKQLEFSNGPKIHINTQKAQSISASINPNQLKSIISNIINNSHEAGARNVRISLAKTSESLAINIKDDGPGFDTSLLGKVGRAMISSKTQGNGIGLLSAAKIINSWGGNFSIDNLPDGGAHIHFTLPRA